MGLVWSGYEKCSLRGLILHAVAMNVPSSTGSSCSAKSGLPLVRSHLWLLRLLHRLGRNPHELKFPCFSPSVGWDPPSSERPDLFVKMQVRGHHPRPTDSDALGVRPHHVRLQPASPMVPTCLGVWGLSQGSAMVLSSAHSHQLDLNYPSHQNQPSFALAGSA